MSLGPQFAVVLADPDLARTGEDARASAVAAAPRRMFEALGAWAAVANEAQPILDMVVTDSRLDDAARPVFLTFGGEIEPGEPFAHMIENGRLIAALSAKAASAGVHLVATPVTEFDAGPGQTNVRLGDGSTVTAKLLVAADGARSRLREQAGIAIHGWSYGQSAIVTTVTHERDHHGRAEEHFLPAGPFAILPLRHNRSSIVWTEQAEEAKAASSRCRTTNFITSSKSGSACGSARSWSRVRDVPIRSDCGWRAVSLRIASPWSATPPT